MHFISLTFQVIANNILWYIMIYRMLYAVCLKYDASLCLCVFLVINVAVLVSHIVCLLHITVLFLFVLRLLLCSCWLRCAISYLSCTGAQRRVCGVSHCSSCLNSSGCTWVIQPAESDTAMAVWRPCCWGSITW